MKKIIVTARVAPTFLYHPTEKLLYEPFKTGNQLSQLGRFNWKLTSKITRPVLMKDIRNIFLVLV